MSLKKVKSKLSKLSKVQFLVFEMENKEKVVKFRVYKVKPYQNSNKALFGVTINGKTKTTSWG